MAAVTPRAPRANKDAARERNGQDAEPGTLVNYESLVPRGPRRVSHKAIKNAVDRVFRARESRG